MGGWGWVQPPTRIFPRFLPSPPPPPFPQVDAHFSIGYDASAFVVAMRAAHDFAATVGHVYPARVTDDALAAAHSAWAAAHQLAAISEAGLVMVRTVPLLCPAAAAVDELPAVTATEPRMLAEALRKVPRAMVEAGDAVQEWTRAQELKVFKAGAVPAEVMCVQKCDGALKSVLSWLVRAETAQEAMAFVRSQLGKNAHADLLNELRPLGGTLQDAARARSSSSIPAHG